MEWPKVSLGELLRLERRPVEVRPDANYQEIGIYCFGKGIFHKETRSGLEVGDKDLFLMKEGDFILQVTFAWEGAIAIVSTVEDGMYGSVRYPTFRVDERRCFAPFLLSYFKTYEGRQQLLKICPGSAGRNRVLSMKRVPEILVPLPPLQEQRRIVTQVEKLTSEINEAQTLRRESAKEAHSLGRGMAASLLDRVGALYPIFPLSDLVGIRGGGTPSKSNPQYWQGCIPWISPKDMKSRVIRDAIDHISEHAVQETPAKLIDPGAVLIVVRGMILAHTVPSALLHVKAAINQDMKALIPRDKILPEFLCCALWAYNSRVLDLVEKSTHDTRKLETAKLLGFRIPVPPIEEQRNILIEFDLIQSQINMLKTLQSETAIELDAVLPALLDRAFAGQL